MKHKSTEEDQGCGELVYSPDFNPDTFLNGKVSRPVDDAEFQTEKGAKFIFDTPSQDMVGTHSFNLGI